MDTPRRKKLGRRIALAILLPVALLFLVSGAFPWSPLNCWHEEVDLNTGRVRHTNYLLYCKTGDRTEETWLSRAIGSPQTPPDWRRVNTFSPGVGHSPHYRYHGAISQIEILEEVDFMLPFDPDARRKAAETLLELWRNADTDFEGNEYVQRVGIKAMELRDAGETTMRETDLP